MKIRKFILTFACVLLALMTIARAADKPVPAIEHVLIISVDGMRPDLMLRANTPRMHKLMDEGSFSMWAKTIPASVTLPSHVSMLTGVPPEVHGIMWNADLKFTEPVYPSAPTIFELAKRAGISTAMSAGKSKFAILEKPHSIDWSFVAPDLPGDDDVVANAVTMIRYHQPGLLFVHLPMADNVGHSKGWGSSEQIAAFEQIDREIGKILDAIADQKLTDSTFVILTADHGGAGRSHGPEDPRSRTIPWIAAGPGIRKNFDLTRLGPDFNIETYDTFSTALAMLGVSSQRHVWGKFITQIVEKQDLTLPGKPPNNAPTTNPTTNQSMGN